MGFDQIYAAMKVDIVNSRKIADREKLQKKFIKLTNLDANIIFLEAIKSQFIVTHGDELQVLLKVNQTIMDIINYFLEEMHPLKIRFGIGIGTLSTEPKPTAIGMDGEAFHFAKKAIDIAHQRKKVVIVETNHCSYIPEINTIFDLMFTIREDWSDIQREIISLVRQEHVQESIASYLNISQPAVSKNLKRAKWKNYLEAESLLRQRFDQLIP